MGSATGAIKTAARRLGVSVEEYQRRRAADEKWCRLCKQWKPAVTFAKDASRGDGLKSICSEHEARTRPGPSLTERRCRAALGQAWCRSCSDWLPAGEVRQGICRAHAAAYAKEHYRGPAGDAIRAQKKARRRSLAPIPAWWQVARFEDFGRRCAYGCGRSASSVDHIWPVARGGRSVPGNLVPACTSCNSSKKDTDPHPWVIRGVAAFPGEWTDLVALAIEHSTDEWVEVLHG
ncbi:HNH endonuclease (plasmid) [Streptomyces canus]|uniref:HNH endonuclease n=1 Tax=Streptomyces canus TaxID=58343 RepID=UPI002F91AAB8|nr:HNH endonuclease [Streptomyces canus]